MLHRHVDILSVAVDAEDRELPLLTDPGYSRSSTLATAGETCGTPLHVLFFEDDTEDIELTLCTLQDAGFAVQADVACSSTPH